MLGLIGCTAKLGYVTDDDEAFRQAREALGKRQSFLSPNIRVFDSFC